ncbi:hypothetical protein Pan216_19750 [Planctomycetes bacterium Pan216]|uniref:Uncharacterized protein n=1 Tax=Kolteria novifilia TaxID=2527975 RepID=A0A518B2A3_9BACT|nr:hypothetical protein Pan216_19750 [Planctomycetes bacterium Pan216]
MTSESFQRGLPWAIRYALRRVRFWLVTVATFDGIALAALGIVLVGWLSLVVDFGFEPDLPTRVVLLAFGLGAIVWLTFRYVVARLLARPNDRQLAMLLERRLPELGDRLVTAIELLNGPHPFSDPFVVEATMQANERLEGFSMRRILRISNVWRHGLLLLAALAITLTLVSTFPVTASTWFERVALLRPIRYPRATHLLFDHFEDGTAKVAKGRDFEFNLAADPDGVVPERVRLKFWMRESGTSGSSYLTKIGSHRFRHVFQDVLEPITFWVRGGDDSSDYLRLIVVEAPVLEKVTLHSDYPAHTRLGERETELTGGQIPLPFGTQATLTLGCNKPLQSMRCLVGEEEMPIERLDERTFSVRFPVEQSLALRITYEDIDGIGPEETFPIDIISVPDEAPYVQASPEGIGTSVTPRARLPIRLSVKDDHGIADLAFRVRRGRSESASSEPTNEESASEEELVPIAMAEPLSRKVRVLGVFDLLERDLSANETLSLSVQATDGDLLTGPKTGTSETFPFRVVTAEDLLSLLSQRELALRQRFEQIIRELVEAREGLEPLHDEQSATPTRRRLHVERILHRLRKSENEVGGVLGDFREIALEIDNNRIESDALRQRLASGIIRPLDAMTGEDFPACKSVLASLRDAPEGDIAEPLQVAEAHLDRLIRTARSILESMEKMESFNEVVALLKQILEDQEELTEKTRLERKKRVLDLLR